MREIKFRVFGWNKDKTISYFEIKNGQWMPEGYIPENVVIQQFTGLTDKNGQEIYEGDIIFNEYGSKNIEKGFVEYRHGSLFYYYTKENYWPLEPSTNTDILEGIEVIGNIFENQELINN